MGFQLIGKFGLDGSGFSRGLDKAETRAKRSAKTIGKSFSGLKGAIAGAFGVAAIGRGVSSTLDEASQITDAAKRLGVGAKFLQELNANARKAGQEVSVAQEGFIKLAQAQDKAVSGNKQLLESFSRYGVTLDDLKSKSTEELFRQVAGAMKGATVDGKMLNDTTALFGEEFNRMLPSITFGFEAIAKQALLLGHIWDDAVLARMDQTDKRLEDAVHRVKPVIANVIDFILALFGSIFQSDVFKAIVGIFEKFTPLGMLAKLGGSHLGKVSVEQDIERLEKAAEVQKATGAPSQVEMDNRIREINRKVNVFSPSDRDMPRISGPQGNGGGRAGLQMALPQLNQEIATMSRHLQEIRDAVQSL